MTKVSAVLLSLSLLLTSLVASAVDWPTLSGPVVDDAHLLSAQETREISTWLRSYRQQGRAQIQVVTVPNLQGLPIEEYSIKLVEQWKLGGSVKDDGILFLISRDDRQMRIEVGQGLEGALTDLQSKRILDDRVRPLFKSQKFALGIVAGLYEIIATVDPEYAGQQAQTDPQWAKKPTGKKFPFWLIFFLFLMLAFGGRGRRRGGFLGPFGAGALGGWAAGRNWPSGGGFGGGGGGGGWSGGGGGFSGGGASSNW